MNFKNCFKLLIGTAIITANISKAQSVKFMRTANSSAALRIMKTLYGGYDAKMNRSAWMCKDLAMLNQYSIKNQFEFISNIWSCDSLVQNESKNYYCVISSVPNDFDYQCHECGAIEEFVIFKAVGNNLKLVYKKQFAKFGNWGVSPFFKVKKVGDNLLYLFNPGTTSAGITVTNIALYAFDKSEFKNLLLVKEAAKDNEGNCSKKVANSCYSYDYVEKFMNSNQNYSDIIITRTGTIKKAGKVVSANVTQQYKFDGSIYQLTTAQ